MYTLPSDAIASSVYFTRYIDISKDVVVSFDFTCYGASEAGSEGFCVFFSDTTADAMRYGGPGPGLCYSGVSGVKLADKTSFPGLLGGLIGVGFDITGNYGSDLFFSTGSQSLLPNTITVRGPQSPKSVGIPSYAFITRNLDMGTYNYKAPIRLYEQVIEGNTPTYKRARVRLSDFGNRLVVDLKKVGDVDYVNYLDYNVGEFVSWPRSIRVGLGFSTGLLTNTIFKIKNFNVNGNFTEIADTNQNTYTYDTDLNTLSGSYVTYFTPTSVLQPDDLIHVANVNTFNLAYSGTNNVLILVDPKNGPEGAPYQSGDNLVKITVV